MVKVPEDVRENPSMGSVLLDGCCSGFVFVALLKREEQDEAITNPDALATSME